MSNSDSRVARRDFLKVTAAAGLTSGLSTPAAAKDDQACSNPAAYASQNVPLQVRRVVTGHDSQGRAVVTIDEIYSKITSARPGHHDALLWTTGAVPADNVDPADGAQRQGTNATVFRIAKYDPGVAPRNHRTETIDYALVLSGEIDMEMDQGSVTLRQGDALIQRGTIHNWVNRGTVPCVIAFILIQAKPIKPGEAATH
jgi:mannose-6-phosphate isomerase-like protein (cupin superfamily)